MRSRPRSIARQLAFLISLVAGAASLSQTLDAQQRTSASAGTKAPDELNATGGLRELAAPWFSVGVGVGVRIADRPQDWPLLTTHFEYVTPENCMKVQGVQATEGAFRFEEADRFVEFAAERQLELVGHLLVWAKDDRTPPWFFKDGDSEASPELLLDRMRTHIETVVGRYKGRIATWDVVNEALADGPEEQYLRDSGWSRLTGEEFLIKAFEYARAADSDAFLVYNDYRCDTEVKRRKLIRLARMLRSRNAPVDAIGLQGHYELDAVPYEGLEETLKAMRALGFKVVVSELDIDVVTRGRWWAEGGRFREELASFDPYKDGCPPEILQRQADQYARLFRLFVKYADVVERVSFWNLHDGQSWLNYFPWNRVNHPLLFDRQQRPKPAFHAVAEELIAAAREGAAGRPKPVVFTVQEDHQNMMDQLGIAKLRRGRSANKDAPNAANYDEALANPYPDLPDVMRLVSGKRVTTPEDWWEKRRPEIVEAFEREVVGRVPATVPAVKWEVRETREVTVGEVGTVEKRLVGVVDNSACPEIEVNISMSLTVPKDAAGPVPVLMMFGWTPFDPPPPWLRGRGRGFPRRRSSREIDLISAGWGYAKLNPTTVQDDAGGFRRNRFGRRNDNDDSPRGAGLTRGIIGLTHLGQPRKPDDWGALRAWAWGASRGLDYLDTDPGVDAKKVGIEGVSRYGKAALVTMAFDQRFAMGLIGSSGEGGTSLHRRNFGEAVENLTGSGEYHWMAGNFLKYGAEESAFGSMNPGDLPVDAHQLIALCAPRLTFISYGIPEKGDAHWLDHQGSFMAAIAAQPVFRLLGARDLGRSDHYKTEKMPAVNVDLLDGHLAWRQHDGGHTDAPNMPHFIRWADRLLGRTAAD